MAETKPNENQDKPKKSRSLGSFLLFLTVLIAILIVIGGEGIRSSVELTQDQFLYKLYTGQVDTQEFRGANIVEGKLIDGSYFKVRVVDLKDRDEDLRQLKAPRGRASIYGQQLTQAIAVGCYRPIRARLLNVNEVQSTPAKDGQPPVNTYKRSAELQVQVFSKSTNAWKQELTNESDSADGSWPTPDVSGPIWLKVKESEAMKGDLGSLVASLETAGTSVEYLEFDISRDKGTSAHESGDFLNSFLLYMAPFILVFVIFLLFMRQMRNQGGAGGVMSFGRSRAQLYSKENHTNTTFDDVAGAGEAKEEVREVVEFLKNPGRFTRIGGRIPRGILLVGPPGCGKTLLAKAIAGEAEVPFFSISGSDFVEMFVGVGASRVRDLFKQARENCPCIIFLTRSTLSAAVVGAEWAAVTTNAEQTLNAILVEMDGFSTDEGIIIIAATNRPDVLDPALLRPGRFDRDVTIDLPDIEGREAILATHLKKVRASSKIDLPTLARSTPGYSGADLAAVINEAAIMAVLQNSDEVQMDHLEEARDKVRYGRQKKSRKLEEEDREITAYHEAGHAIVASVLENTDPPHKVTIVPRGRSLGSTMILPEKESYHMQKKRLISQLAVAFGGRVAEARFCGDVSAGASDDIKRATELARAMVSELGMSDKIGPINYAERQGSDFLGTELMNSKWHSEKTAHEIDLEVQTLLKNAYDTAVRIIEENAEAVEKVTRGLMRYETVTGAEIDQLIEGTPLEDLRPSEPQKPLDKPIPPTPVTQPEKPSSGEEDLSGDVAGEPGFSPA